MSQAMRRFGSKVKIIDRNGPLMSKQDPDVCEALRSLLADEGIDILLNARIKQVSGKSGDSVSVVVEQNGIEKVQKGCHVLVATGRSPNTEGLGLELAGVELTDRGYIKVNERPVALHRAARCGQYSPNTSRRSHISVVICCISAQRCRYKRSPDRRRIRCRAQWRRELRLELPRSTARRFAEGTTPVTGLDGIVVAMQSYYPSIPWRAPSLFSIPGPIRHQQRHRPTCFSCC